MRPLSRNWEESYDHHALFVVPFIVWSRFSGTCYKAAGFKELGETRGDRRNNGRYYYHGQVKKILVRPLPPDASRILSDPSHWPIFQSKEPVVPVKALSEEDFRHLVEILAEISDSGKKRGFRHKAVDPLVTLLVCAILSGPMDKAKPLSDRDLSALWKERIVAPFSNPNSRAIRSA